MTEECGSGSRVFFKISFDILTFSDQSLLLEVARGGSTEDFVVGARGGSPDLVDSGACGGTL